MTPLSIEIKNQILSEKKNVSVKDIEEYEKLLSLKMEKIPEGKKLSFDDKEKLRDLYIKLFK